jgi:ABC-2 type transport system permease protein
MNPISLAVTDSSTMLRRNLLRMRRYPSMTVLLVALPILPLLLFVYVFGGTLGAGLSTGAVPGGNGRAAYLDYVTPAIMLMAAASAAQGTAITVAMDRTEGILARFRTMAISPSSVLTGHVLGSVIQSLMAVGVLLGVALLLGFRPDAGPLEWVALLGIIGVTAFALTWLCVAFGLVSKSVETASNLPNFLILLPFLSSGFVPVESMPAGVAWFAEYQPFTPVIETIRGLFAGSVEVGTALTAVGWCLLVAVTSYLWSRSLFRRAAAR